MERSRMHRALPISLAALLVFALVPAASAVVPGDAGPAVRLVDHVMTGDFFLVNHSLVFDGGSLNSTATGILMFDGKQLCVVDGNCPGTPGPQGDAGPMGPQGPQGETGAMGATGATGAAGATGPQGETGPVGPQGATGETGPMGPAGADGALNAWGLLGNAGTTAGTNFVGTTDAKDLVFKVNGEQGFRLQQRGTDTPNVIGGYWGNFVAAGIQGATIGGGGGYGGSHAVRGTWGTVSGGVSNGAVGEAATVSGGVNSNALGHYSSVGGGWENGAVGAGSRVGGGATNQATGWYATIGAGEANRASGLYSTIGGGLLNTASAPYASVIGGRQGQASHYGEIAHAAGQFFTPGDAQNMKLVLRSATHQGVPTRELFLDNSSLRLTMPTGSAWTLDVSIAARDTSTNAAAYRFTCGAMNIAGTASFVNGGACTQQLGLETNAAWDVTIGTSDNAVTLTATGVGSGADSFVWWVATVDVTQVIAG